MTVIPASPTEQRQLLALQEVDTAIRQLEHRRANLPEQKALDDNAETLRRVAAEYAAAREERDTLERRQRRLEEEVATIDARRRSEERRMYSGLITSEKELEAIRGELSSLRSRKNDLEDSQLEVMERLEELASLVDTLAERHDELTRQVDELTAARDQAATGIDTELSERRAERAKAADGVDAEVLGYYDDLRSRKAGVAVAELQGRTCSGCRLDLTAIELEETHERVKQGLAKCPQCDRILVT